MTDQMEVDSKHHDNEDSCENFVKKRLRISLRPEDNASLDFNSHLILTAKDSSDEKQSRPLQTAKH